MGRKQNPVLEAYEAMLEKKYRAKLELNSEFDMIAFMLTINEDLQVGPGRAGRLFNDFLANKVELAEAIHADYGPDKDSGDKEILHTKKEYAQRLRAIFGAEKWKAVRGWFTWLKDYWGE